MYFDAGHTSGKPWIIVDLTEKRQIQQFTVTVRADGVSHLPNENDLVLGVGDEFDDSANPKFQFSTFQTCAAPNSGFGLGKLLSSSESLSLLVST